MFDIKLIKLMNKKCSEFSEMLGEKIRYLVFCLLVDRICSSE